MATKQAIQRQTATYTYFSFCVSNLKMWTVSVLLEAERYRLSILNASEQMLTHLRRQARQHTCTEEMVNAYKSVHRRYEESKLQCMSRLPLDSSSKLKELLSLWDREDTDDCTLRGSEKKKAQDVQSCNTITGCKNQNLHFLMWKTKLAAEMTG